MTELQLDHIVVAVPDLELAKSEFASKTGVTPIDGGPHPGRGTCNALVSFGASSYLELIAPDPQQTLAGTNGAKFAELHEPQLLHWALRTTDLAAVSAQTKQAGLTPGAIHSMSRNTPQGEVLNWRLMGLSGHSYGGLLPFYIDWLDCPHPTLSAPAVGRLKNVAVSLPSAELQGLFKGVVGVVAQQGQSRLSVSFDSRGGEQTYRSTSPQGFGFG